MPIAAAIARRQGITPDRIDDVVQDVLLAIHRARHLRSRAALRAVAAPAEARDGDDVLDWAEQAALLATAIEREHSLEQAAGETGRSKVALKVNLDDAIAALRRRLAEAGDA